VNEMLWIVQKDLWDEEGYVGFINALDRLGKEYLIIKPVPFTNRILPADFDSFEQDINDVEEPFIDTTQTHHGVWCHFINTNSESAWLVSRHLHE